MEGVETAELDDDDVVAMLFVEVDTGEEEGIGLGDDAVLREQVDNFEELLTTEEQPLS